MIINQPSVVGQPDNLNSQVWRYTDLAGFVSLISSQQLSFNRADKFEDPYEGIIPDATFERYQNEGNERYLELIQNIRTNTFINCWHMNESESEAMWQLYASKGKGVAIKSTYKSLKNSVDGKVGDHRIHIGLVKYKDYIDFDPQEGNFTKYFFSKRAAFRHENEVRLYAPPSSTVSSSHSHTRLNVPVRLDELIHEVRVAPDAGEWFRELVADLLNKYKVQKEVKKSHLSILPKFLND